MEYPRIVLSKLEDSDIEKMFEWINNKDLVEFNAPFKRIPWEDHCKWFELIRQRENVKIFGIRLIKSNILIGSCQLFNIDYFAKTAELQIRIGDFYYLGKGYGTEAVKLLIKFGFDDLKLEQIYLHVFSDNLRAYNSYIKNGFLDMGLLKEGVLVKDKLKKIRLMSIKIKDCNL